MLVSFFLSRPTSHSSWPVVILLLPLSLSHVPDSLTHARPRQKRAGDAGVMKDQSKRVRGTAISTCGFLMNLITPADSSLGGSKGGWAVFTGVIIYYEKDQHLKGAQVWGSRVPTWLVNWKRRRFWRYDLFPQTWGHGVKGHLSFLMGRHVTGLLQEWMRALDETVWPYAYGAKTLSCFLYRRFCRDTVPSVPIRGEMWIAVVWTLWRAVVSHNN